MLLTTAGPQDRQRPRIVIVDDDPAHLQVVKIILTREALVAELHLFEEPIKALEYLETGRVNLILLDVGMSQMDGFAVFERIRNAGPNQATPVIFLTAFKETETILRAFEMGAADVLGKPLISPILIARIRAILDTQDLQRQLRQRNEELEASNRLKDEMLSICSHDLRSPLSAIDLICQFLQEERGKQSKAVLVNRIVNQSRLARRLVDNLLDLNRIEEGMLVPTPSFFRIRDLIASCADDEGPMMQARGLRLEQALPEDNLLCFADREMIAQVLRNLLGNAIKFTRSTVSLGTRMLHADDPSGGAIEIVISDDGPGVSAEELPSIFDKYRKGDQRNLGSGLGLFISRKMLELHGGRIEVRSAPGKGAHFTLSLPNVFPVSAMPDLSGMTEGHVLVLSASKQNALLLEGILVEASLVHVSKDWSPDAAAERPLPQLIVLDAQLPPREVLGQIAPLLKAAQVSPAWILIGSEAEAGTLLPWIAGQAQRLATPLNPLVFLRRVETLLAEREAASVSARLSPVGLARDG
jgi:two-component system sensor histidine kinase/response regulator